MSDSSTQPADIQGMDGRRVGLWQQESAIWSFGPEAARVVGALEYRSAQALPSQNTIDTSTKGPQAITAPAPPSLIRRPSGKFGKRAFQALFHWEGVVEEVKADRFIARLVPLNDASGARVEFTDFRLDELADPDDRELVEPGAVFYWTIGRLTNEAGTTFRVSLVRFRRIPAPGPYQQREAALKAEKILQQFGGTDRPDST